LNDQYLEVYISDLSRHEEDLISAYLFSIGSLGVCENLNFEQTDLRFNPRVKFNTSLHLTAYFDISSYSPDLIEKIKSHFPGVSVTMIKAENKDWMEEWKKGYEAFPLTGDIWVVPSWKPVPEEAKMPIFIDPGMAFGTGTHETTQICARLIQDFLKTNSCSSAFDVGTGTGILAMLMSKLGVPKIKASDIDRECERVSKENLGNNKVENVEWSEDFSRDEDRYDLIVANIIDGVLVDLKNDFKEHALPTTQFIMSGILLEREQEFLQNILKDWPLEIRQRHAMKEWVGFWFSPKNH
jgi:ribosomal protein L11 methyltransferase